MKAVRLSGDREQRPESATDLENPILGEAGCCCWGSAFFLRTECHSGLGEKGPLALMAGLCVRSVWSLRLGRECLLALPLRRDSGNREAGEAWVESPGAVLGSAVHFKIGPQETLIILSVPHTDSAMVQRFANSESHCLWCYLGQGV